ncbi:hypothetical protein V9T40_008373 [Parthenolecanium corni]|uniref:Uncharacterized protein n=1 Tax=Parthenolecanium corni TaxID=536013 RepID=A0AAN9Y7T6_9HEMI
MPFEGAKVQRAAKVDGSLNGTEASMGRKSKEKAARREPMVRSGTSSSPLLDTGWFSFSNTDGKRKNKTEYKTVTAPFLERKNQESGKLPPSNSEYVTRPQSDLPCFTAAIVHHHMHSHIKRDRIPATPVE